jgi:hypothetical protein
VNAYRDLVRDEAVATAKAYGAAEVEPRHLLWGLLEALGDTAPVSVSRAAAHALLLPRGTAIVVPTVPAAIDQRLAAVTDPDTAIELATALAAELLSTPGAGPSGGDVRTRSERNPAHGDSPSEGV